MKNVSDQFVDNLYGIAINHISDTVLEQARLCVLDYVGCSMAGAKMMNDKNERFINNVIKQQGNSTIIGYKQKVSLHNAAFLNAMNTHATELDDGHRFGMIHLGASILSALLAVAEIEKVAYKDVLIGTVVGYETASRLAMAMQPSHKTRGYHTSGTCGTVGSAMAIAAALHFSRSEMKSALSSAVAGAGGLLEMQEDDSELKPYNLAHAAVAGIVAAYAAKTGYVGPLDPLGGKRGMLAVMSENSKVDLITTFPDNQYEIERIYRKSYAACRHCHSAIEAALRIQKENHIFHRDIKLIHVETYEMGKYGHDHKIVNSIASAKLSTPFGVALALVKGNAGINEFSQINLIDSDIQSLCQKIDVVENKQLTILSPNKRASIVTIETNDGKQFMCKVDYPKGEPENPMNRQDVENKFIETTGFYGLNIRDSLNLIQEIIQLEDDMLFLIKINHEKNNH